MDIYKANGSSIPGIEPHLDTQDTLQTIKSDTTSGTFTLFPQLPFDLRLKIWSQALVDIAPRVVEATFSCPSPHLAIPSSSTPTPGLLHTSLESRFLALKTYSPLSINEFSTSAYIDYNKDILFLTSSSGTNHCLRSLLPTPFFSLCRRLALTDLFYWSLAVSTIQPRPFLAQFKCLDELSVVYLRNECVNMMNKNGSVSYGTGDIVQRDGSMVFGKRGIDLGPGCVNDKRCGLIARHLAWTVFHNPNIQSGNAVVISKGYHKIDNERTTPLSPDSQYCHVCARYRDPTKPDLELKCDEHSYSALLLPEDIRSKPELETLGQRDEIDAELISETVMMGEEYALQYSDEVANY